MNTRTNLRRERLLLSLALLAVGQAQIRYQHARNGRVALREHQALVRRVELAGAGPNFRWDVVRQ